MTEGPPAPFDVPLLDLPAQNKEVWPEVRQGWEAVVARGDFILGEEVDDFERAFATFSGVARCVGVANGTDALELALRAAGVRPGDEVILPANSFIATALAVMRAGAAPRLVDVDDVLLAIDQEHAVAAITPRTKAVVPVHLFGHIAPMADLLDHLHSTPVGLIEDAAQAHGARLDGRPAGSFGAAGAVSFYPSKNLGALGDGGAVLTDRADLADRVRSLRDYGRTRPHHHDAVGFNSRLDTVQAVVLSAKLRRLEEWTAGRVQAAGVYDRLLADLDEVRRPGLAPGAEPCWHLYVVRVPERDRVLRSLHNRGIGAAVHYPVPIHLQPAMAALGLGAGSFPVAESSAKAVLSLPMFPTITEDQQVRVVDALRSAVRS